MFTPSSLAFSTDAAFGRWMVQPTPIAFIRRKFWADALVK
jgi:hypothetical protein